MIAILLICDVFESDGENVQAPSDCPTQARPKIEAYLAIGRSLELSDTTLLGCEV